MSTFIIAEAGVNMNGDIDTAYKLVDAARDARVDAVKFQTFWGLTNHPTLTDEELHDLELTKDEWRQLKDYCDKVGIEFMSTPDTIRAVDFLAEIGMKKWKVGSGSLTKFSMLGRIREKMPEQIFMSTGMHCKVEWIQARNILGKANLLLCVSEYPASPKNMSLRGAFKDFDGLSDHTLGIEIPIAAVALGASVIEKHFTLDKSMRGPDHSWALEPKELTEMVRCIRNVELVLTYYDIDNGPTPKELELRSQFDLMREFA